MSRVLSADVFDHLIRSVLSLGALACMAKQVLAPRQLSARLPVPDSASSSDTGLPCEVQPTK